jgi:hypothetical protein
MRVLRQLEMVWFIPIGLHRNSDSKPWRWVSYMLGTEVCGRPPALSIWFHYLLVDGRTALYFCPSLSQGSGLHNYCTPICNHPVPQTNISLLIALITHSCCCLLTADAHC